MRTSLRLHINKTGADLPRELSYFLSMTLQALLVARLTIRAGMAEGSAFLLALALIPASLLLQSLMTPGESNGAGAFSPTGIRLCAVVWLAGMTFLSPDLWITLFGVAMATVLFAFAEAQTDEPLTYDTDRSWLKSALIPLCLGAIMLTGELTGSFF